MLAKTDYDNNVMKLIDEKTGADLNIGSKVKTFDKERAILTGGRPPHKPGSTGRVYVKFKDGAEREFYPGVINAKWVIV